MKVKAKQSGEIVKVKMLISHIMETGRRKDDAGKLIPGHYITEVVARYQDKIVFHVETGSAVSKDPYLAFAFKGGVAGDKLTVSWVDNQGNTETTDAVIK